MNVLLLGPEHTQELDTRLDQEYYDRTYQAELHRGRSKNTDLINQDLARTRRAIVVIGCSYADGQGSIPNTLTDFCEPVYEEAGNHWDYSQGGIDRETCAELALKFDLPLSFIQDKQRIIVPTRNTELDNSWASQIGTQLNHDYTVVNCADRGFGNNSSIQKLLLYPIDWSLCDEVLVLWSVCDFGRYSILQSYQLDLNHLGNDGKTFWPFPPEQTEPDTGNELAWYWQKDMCADPRFYMERYLENCKQLDFFAKSFKRGQIVKIPAFSSLPEESSEWFDYANHVEMLHGDHMREAVESRFNDFLTWDVDGKEMITNLLYYAETSEHLRDHWMTFWNGIRGTGSQGGMFTPCTHPSYQGQTLIAQKLHNYLVTEVL